MLIRGKLTITAVFAALLIALFSYLPPAPEHKAPELLQRAVVSREVPSFILSHLPGNKDELEPLPVLMAAGQSSVIGVQLFEKFEIPAGEASVPGPLQIEYTFDAELMRRVRRILSKGRVRLGHVVVMDPKTGRLLAYVSTDEVQFSPTRVYPAASLMKVVTAAATLHHAPEKAKEICRYRGSPYRLTASRVKPPKGGNEVSFRRALATSNNQCFAQYAVGTLGRENLLDAMGRFGFLESPAPGHAPGQAQLGEDDYDLGRVGCGLAGCQITPLHAVSLAATLATGQRVSPYWIERVTDGMGQELILPEPAPPRTVLTPELAEELRTLMVETTQTGTARKAFRNVRGRPLLGSVKVAGKTGSLSGKNPTGRYEWFVGLAPASEPTVAIAVLVVQNELWWKTASQIAADVLKTYFCSDGVCRSDSGTKWMPASGS